MLSSLFFALTIISAPHAFAQGTWTTYTGGNSINSMAIRGNYLWCATGGGLVRWDTRDLSYRKFTSTDGLPRNGLTSLTVTPDGVVWFGSNVGLTRYDGTGFQTLTEADGLISNQVLALAAAPDGSVWIGMEDGLCRYDGHSMIAYTEIDGIKLNHISVITIAPDRTLWFSRGADLAGIFHLDGDSLQYFGTIHAESFAALPDGRVYASYYGIYEYKNGEWVRQDQQETGRVRALTYSPDGMLWGWGIGLGDTLQLSQFDGNIWKYFPKSETYNPSFIHHYSMAVDSNGVIWVGDEYGLFRFDGATWSSYTSRDGVGKDRINSLAVDSDNTLWVGTDNSLVHYDRSMGISSFVENVYPIWLSLAPDGTIFCGHYEMIYRLDGGRLIPCYVQFEWPVIKYAVYSPRALSRDSMLLCIASTGHGMGGINVWEGTDAENYTLKRYIEWSESFMEGFRAAVIAPDSTSAFGTPNGLLYFGTDKNSIHFTMADGLPDNNVTSVALAPNGDIWCGTPKGVCRYDGRGWRTFSESDGVSFTHFTASAFASDGSAWFTFVGGVSRFDGKSWKIWTMADGLADPEVLSIAVSPDGTVWVGTAAGLSKYSPEKPNTVEERNSQPVALAITGNHPNPFNPSTTISFTLPASGEATLSVYDITGRKVRTLVSGNLPAGAHSAVWDGKDERGKAASSGVYLSRLESGKATHTAKMLLMK